MLGAAVHDPTFARNGKQIGGGFEAPPSFDLVAA